MGGKEDSEESSDSDHRPKRRRTNHMGPATPNGMASVQSVASPAAPNSFAAKMMAKMGYVEGQGLGSTGRGRLAPIETQLRPQGAGLGAVKEKTKQAKEEEKREAAFRGEVLEDSEEEEKKRRKKLKEKRMHGAMSGSGPGTPRSRPKPKYRTALELQAETEGLEVPKALLSIYDATGRETKLVSSTAGLMVSQSTMVPAETESMKISRKARRDLDAFADEWTSLQALKSHNEDQKNQLEQELEREEEDVVAMESLITAITELQAITAEDSTEDNTILETLVTKLEAIERFVVDQENQDVFGLQEIAVAAIYPPFRTAMEGWKPLEQPSSVVPYLERLRDIIGMDPKSTEIALQNGNSYAKTPNKSTTHFETMMYTLWLPPVRSAITNDWDVYDSKTLTTLIDIWKPVLPPFILANVIDQLVVRRLSEAVTAWRPRKSQNQSRHRQPHQWLFPWLPYLDEQHTDPRSSTGLLADVKRKFKSILSTWDLSGGVLPGLDKWRSIFRSDLSTMLVRHVLPRHALHLSENFVVDPSDQDLTPLEDVLKWNDHFALSTMAQLLIAEFFPKWHHTLYLWLTSETPSYEEIQKWYQWWKQELEDRLPTINDLVAAEWEKGLETLNLALDALGNGVDVSTVLAPPSATKSGLLAPSVPVVATEPSKSTIIEAIATFKDVVEEWCAENGLLMVPLREADVQSGLPLFRLTASSSGKGGIVVYLKGDVVWVRDRKPGKNGEWNFIPMGLDNYLVSKAENK
ncbi:tuftelin-interacting protein 11, partial [Lecanoromycetidae sp. Uapishka_2]